MSSSLKHNQGMYFEEFQVGQKVVSPGRTITESDIVNFAGLSGDYTSIHTDAESVKETPFGRRVAHGLLGLSIASGLLVRTGALEGTVIAFREIKNWKFVRPIFIGDTVHVVLEVSEKKGISRIGGGSIIATISLLNQDGEKTMKGKWIVLVTSKPD